MRRLRSQLSSLARTSCHNWFVLLEFLPQPRPPRVPMLPLLKTFPFTPGNLAAGMWMCGPVCCHFRSSFPTSPVNVANGPTRVETGVYQPRELTWGSAQGPVWSLTTLDAMHHDTPKWHCLSLNTAKSPLLVSRTTTQAALCLQPRS